MKIRSLALGAALAAATCAPAAAAVYVGQWSARYGAPFASDLGWRGDAEFFVPDGCVLGGTGPVSNVAGCNGVAAVTRATVQLFDTDGPGDLLATMNFAAGSMSISTLYFLAGQLDELDTTVSKLVAPGAEPGVDLGDHGVAAGLTTFGLRFAATGPRLHFLTCRSATDCDTGINDADHPPDFRITRVPDPVPEPRTLLLALLALGATATARRKR